MTTKQLDVAKTIYNLTYDIVIEPDNYEFELDNKLNCVTKLLFKKEKKTIMFSNITGKELYKHFNRV